MLTIGLMSGTSLDGVDGVLCEWNPADQPSVLAFAHAAFAADLRTELFALQSPSPNELARAALAANRVSLAYSDIVAQLLRQAQRTAAQVAVIGAHGQTVRHQPPTNQISADQAYSSQLLNPALLAERSGIAVVHDLRSRDLAAGGQGAPLLPIFHARLFAQANQTQAICNIGGIANVTLLAADGTISGFDTGPGNCLMDYWASQHLGTAFDQDGDFAASGLVNQPLLQKMRTEPYFARAKPKSTGRDLFNPAWLTHQLQGFTAVTAADVQATLCELTAGTIAAALTGSGAHALWVCGGGAFNRTLMRRLEALSGLVCAGTSTRGVPEDQVEALAFAWFARQHILAQALDFAAITGAAGPRIAGSYTPR